ncbi:MAG: hypothetical protein DA446_00710 [Bacteroidetes bacterium]|nr:MAG: hypothetical protein DA446_00710 [Bacteroidota bacterium]
MIMITGMILMMIVMVVVMVMVINLYSGMACSTKPGSMFLHELMFWFLAVVLVVVTCETLMSPGSFPTTPKSNRITPN